MRLAGLELTEICLPLPPSDRTKGVSHHCSAPFTFNCFGFWFGLFTFLHFNGFFTIGFFFLKIYLFLLYVSTL
ncbi:mCG1050927 [Mus musculus]|nr:mCG1050927 [Mus musculus]